MSSASLTDSEVSVSEPCYEALRAKLSTVPLHLAPYGPLVLAASKSETCLRIRPSLSDHERAKLDLHARAPVQQRVFIIALLKSDEAKVKFRLQEQLIETVAQCNTLRFTDSDIVTGLLLFTQNCNLLVLEGSDDLLCKFCAEIIKYVENFWTETAVFQVETQFEQFYFESFITHQLESSATAEVHTFGTDLESLKCQHQQLLKKITVICKELASKQRETNEQFEGKCEIGEDLQVNLEIEMQQILKNDKYYRNLSNFTKLFTHPLYDLDDDTFDWEKPRIGVTINVFEHTPYDVNLSFKENISESVE